MNLITICILETVVIIVLVLLILFRKIGRPLSEAEAKEQIVRREQRAKNIKNRRLAKQAEEERRWQKLQEQEKVISELPRPVTFVSLDGDDLVGRTVCVQDGNGKPYTFHCDQELLDLGMAPFFKAIYEASYEPFYNSKIGAIIFR